MTNSIDRDQWLNVTSESLTVIQCKQRYTRTSLPCNVVVVDIRIFSISKASKFSIMQDLILVVSDLVLCGNMYN
jgi:hypothetical protein